MEDGTGSRLFCSAGAVQVVRYDHAANRPIQPISSAAMRDPKICYFLFSDFLSIFQLIVNGSIGESLEPETIRKIGSGTRP